MLLINILLMYQLRDFEVKVVKVEYNYHKKREPSAYGQYEGRFKEGVSKPSISCNYISLYEIKVHVDFGYIISAFLDNLFLRRHSSIHVLKCEFSRIIILGHILFRSVLQLNVLRDLDRAYCLGSLSGEKDKGSVIVEN
jgi:hypothetical protein